jgi:hypothetical protein
MTGLPGRMAAPKPNGASRATRVPWCGVLMVTTRLTRSAPPSSCTYQRASMPPSEWPTRMSSVDAGTCRSSASARRCAVASKLP